ncbi:MAG TPA: spore coat protein U domain-containing protein [Nitrospirota bacterium]|nr:spore coat protein U domain-containing protein [Nitrospirota bacterium]
MNKVVSLASSVVVVALIVLVMGGVALATNSNNLTVSAAVAPGCYFSTLNSTLSFNLDPSVGGNVVTSVSPQFWCTLGTTVTTPVLYTQGLHYSGTSNRMQSSSNPTQFIPYSLLLTPSGTAGLGKSNPLTLTVQGTVLQADYINALAVADYQDSVVITIQP